MNCSNPGDTEGPKVDVEDDWDLGLVFLSAGLKWFGC